jgi:hypothetical protein
MKTTDYMLPAYWASALVNNDFSGVDGEAAEQIRAWLIEEQPGNCLACSGEAAFVWHHDADYIGVLAGDCLLYTFTTLPDKEHTLPFVPTTF